MVPAEVLAELQPFVTLAEGLGRAAVQLVGDGGFSEVEITYRSPRQVTDLACCLAARRPVAASWVPCAMCTAETQMCQARIYRECLLLSLLAWQRSTCVGWCP